MQFDYPHDIEEYKVIGSTQQLKALLNKDRQIFGVEGIYFCISLVKQRYIYANCFKCKSCLHYKKNQATQQFQLFRFSVKHQHPLKGQSKIIQDFMSSFPSTIETKSLKAIVKQKFKLSDSRFYYYLNKIRFSKKSFSDLINYLNQQNYQTSCDPYPLPQSQIFPNYFITVSLEMQHLFKQYGDVCTFDLTYNCVKQFIQYQQNGVSKKRKWSIGFFAGRFWTNKPIIFAIVLTNQQTTESFQKIFLSFLQILNSQGKQISFITDQQLAIKKALINLRSKNLWYGSHAMDSYHLIRTFSKKTKNRQLLTILRNLIMTSSPKQYQLLLQKAKEQIQNEQQAELIKSIDLNSHQFSYCKLGPFFHGVSLSTSSHQKLHDEFKNFIPSQKPSIFVVRKALQFSKMINKKAQSFRFCNVAFEQIFLNYDLKMLRFLTSQNIFRIIIKNYAIGLQLNCRQQDGLVFIVDGETVSPQNKLFKCSCYYFKVSGLPCPHLLLVIKLTKQTVSNYVLSRWKMVECIQKKQDSKVCYSYRGRPKISRRNIF